MRVYEFTTISKGIHESGMRICVVADKICSWRAHLDGGSTLSVDGSYEHLNESFEEVTTRILGSAPVDTDLDLRVKLMGGRAPKRAPGSAGYDLWPMTSVVIEPGSQVMIKLGFATSFREGWVAVVDDRGSTGFLGIGHMAGVIDANFRGEWALMMRNFGKVPFEVRPEKAVAQVLFVRSWTGEVKVVEELDSTLRGAGMLGSSGH